MTNAQQGTNTAGAGATTLSALIPIIYEARDRVAREQIGLITAATTDANEDVAALGQVVRSPVTQATSTAAIVPSNVVPNNGGQTILYKDLTISNSEAAAIQWTGEEQRAVGGLYEGIVRDQFAQAFRSLSNKIEASLVTTMLGGASRAYGTAGTTPFAWSQSNFASAMLPFGTLHLILDTNGAPEEDRQMVLSQKAFSNIRSMPNLYKANEAGTTELLDRGIVMEVEGFQFHKSNQLDRNPHTAGTGSGYVSDGTGAATPSTYQVGETAIKVKSGNGTVVSGDVVTFVGDTNLYVVAGALTGGVLTLAAPGLQQTLADGVAMTVTSAYTANFVMHPQALMLAARMPLMPVGGDAASAVETVFDPISGLSFQIAEYKVYRQVHYEVGAAWGSIANKTEFAGILLG